MVRLNIEFDIWVKEVEIFIKMFLRSAEAEYFAKWPQILLKLK